MAGQLMYPCRISLTYGLATDALDVADSTRLLRHAFSAENPALLPPRCVPLQTTATHKPAALTLEIGTALTACHDARDVLDVLECLNSFTAYGVDDAPTAVHFDALAAYLKAFPSLDRRVQRRLQDVVLDAPRFIDQMAAMLDRIHSEAPASSFMLRALQGLTCVRRAACATCALNPL